MNLLKIIFAVLIALFSLSFFLIGGWGIIALFYAIAYLIALSAKFSKISIQTNDKSTQLLNLSNLISQREMITIDEFNNMKVQLGMKL